MLQFCLQGAELRREVLPEFGVEPVLWVDEYLPVGGPGGVAVQPGPFVLRVAVRDSWVSRSSRARWTNNWVAWVAAAMRVVVRATSTWVSMRNLARVSSTVSARAAAGADGWRSRRGGGGAVSPRQVAAAAGCRLSSMGRRQDVAAGLRWPRECRPTRRRVLRQHPSRALCAWPARSAAAPVGRGRSRGRPGPGRCATARASSRASRSGPTVPRAHRRLGGSRRRPRRRSIASSRSGRRAGRAGWRSRTAHAHPARSACPVDATGRVSRFSQLRSA